VNGTEFSRRLTTHRCESTCGMDRMDVNGNSGLRLTVTRRELWPVTQDLSGKSKCLSTLTLSLQWANPAR